MSNRRINSQERIPFRKEDTYTSRPLFEKKSSQQIENKKDDNIYKALTSITNRLDDLEKENKQLYTELNETKTRENKLLNRFSFLLLIINWGSAIFVIMSVILFIDSFYPFVQKVLETSTGAKLVAGTIGTTIAGGIIAIWLSFNKYVNKVIEREKNTVK